MITPFTITYHGQFDDSKTCDVSGLESQTQPDATYLRLGSDLTAILTPNQVSSLFTSLRIYLHDNGWCAACYLPMTMCDCDREEEQEPMVQPTMGDEEVPF